MYFVEKQHNSIMVKIVIIHLTHCKLKSHEIKRWIAINPEPLTSAHELLVYHI